jgi:putative membrane protein
MSVALLAALHYLGAMVLMACLVAEHLLLKPELDAPRARTLARIDALYGLSAIVQLGSGLARLYSEKGTAFYLSNPLFHAKLTVFVLLGLLSIYPTLRYMAWRRAAQHSGVLMPAEYRRVIMLVRVQLLLLLCIPLLASLMARGIGMG